MDFEKILFKCGDASRYQILMLGLFGYIGFTSTIHYYSQNIISFVPGHWCYHKQLEDKTFEEIASIYAQFGSKASCSRVETVDGHNFTLSSDRCERWIYNYDYGFKSITTEMNWVCDDAYKVRIGQSFFFIGSLLGTWIFGQMGDRFGRLPILILANMFGFVGDLSTSFAKDVLQFAICRFISGSSATANFYLMFTLVLEYVAPRLRNMHFSCTMAISTFLGALAASWLAVWAGNWRSYLACTSLALLAIILFYFVVQESAQWLITRNDIEGATKRLKHIANFNRRQLPVEDWDEFRSHCIEKRKEMELRKDQNVKLLDTLRMPRLRRTILAAIFTFMMNSLAFNTISRNVEGLGMSPFIVFSLFALTIPPSGLIQGLMLNRFGRKGTAFLAMMSTGLLALTVGIIQCFDVKGIAMLLALALPMRLGASMCYSTASQYLSEVMPTCVRSRGIATAHVAGAAASSLSPYLIHLGLKLRAGPSLVLVVVLMSAAAATLMLPETNKRQLPITLEDGELFGKDESIFTFQCIKRKNSDVQPHLEELETFQTKSDAA
ncbi:organic cation transporter protein-like [Scaptodrosophila lebanonensis]|uniref:Organic cation transporter protein-like n=1 Tax=Drosophila lebanonensis TaxID=7225 RepID=A0A6J2UFD4_DROLE|nr:organic cation transporter protein-like [Scaptodrosophila lebanonensis]